MRVLIVDDDAEIRGETAVFLMRHGFKTFTAENGEQGLDSIRGNAPDIVLTDIMMPNKDGIELIMEIRAEKPDLPIIAISGGGSHASPSPLINARHLGADAVLHKPYNTEELLALIAQLCSISSA